MLLASTQLRTESGSTALHGKKARTPFPILPTPVSAHLEAHMRKSIVSILFVFVSIAICLGIVLPACAQTTNAGTVVGVVTDKSNAVVSGANVTLTDPST